MLSESPSQLRVTPHLSAPARDSHLGLALAAAHLGPAPLRTGGRLRRWTWAAAAHQPRQARLRPARLLGDESALAAIVAGKSFAEIKAGWSSGLAEFEARRKAFLLYR